MSETKRKHAAGFTFSSSAEDEAQSEDDEGLDEDEGNDSEDFYGDGDDDEDFEISHTEESVDVGFDHVDNKEEDDTCDDTCVFDRIIRLLQGGSDLQAANLYECKAYLRKHGLRVTGTKGECIQRIKEHWRIKDGNGEALYPKSSFTINCTGDVCKGDVVLFKQRVYKKFNKVERHGRYLGRRTIAGRIVKESYGAAKQQHTFTIEVLWSKGINKLPPVHPLLVKGRNLYKMKTFRQRWKNEAERVGVLAEKHRRGAAARLVRAKKRRNAFYVDEGEEGPKYIHHVGSSSIRRTTVSEKGKHDSRRISLSLEHTQSNFYPKKPIRKVEVNSRQTSKLNLSPSHEIIPQKGSQYRPFRHFGDSSMKHPVEFQGCRARKHNDLGYLNPGYEFKGWNMSFDRPRQLQSSLTEVNSRQSSTLNTPSHEIISQNGYQYRPLRHYSDSSIKHPVEYQGYRARKHSSLGYLDPGYEFTGWNMNFDRPRQLRSSLPSGSVMYRPWKSGFRRCATFGCHHEGCESCVVFSCWECCGRIGRRCSAHQLHQPF